MYHTALSDGHAMGMFPPGSEWTYLKLYCAPHCADEVLLYCYSEVLSHLRTEGALQDWFFVRFADPDFHLRIRIRAPEHDASDIIARLAGALNRRVALDDVFRVQYDTYARETERYGGPLWISLAESLFTIDSDVIASLVALLRGSENPEVERMRLGVLLVHHWFADLSDGDDQMCAWLTAARDALSPRQPSERQAMRRHLTAQYRELRSDIDSVLAHPDTLGTAASVVEEGRRRRSSLLHTILQHHRSLSLSSEHLARDLAHMSLNRLLCCDARRKELGALDCVLRACTARRHRSGVAE